MGITSIQLQQNQRHLAIIS